MAGQEQCWPTPDGAPIDEADGPLDQIESDTGEELKRPKRRRRGACQPR